MYNLAELLGVNDLSYPTIVYARASSSDPKEDKAFTPLLGCLPLERQHAVLEAYCNFAKQRSDNKKGLLSLLELIVDGHISRLVLTHKDRLLRLGGEIIFRICELKGIEVVIINKGEPPSEESLRSVKEESLKKRSTVAALFDCSVKFEEELTGDVMEIMTVFCAKLYGRRSHKCKKMAEEIENIVSDEKLERQFGNPKLEDRTETDSIRWLCPRCV